MKKLIFSFIASLVLTSVACNKVGDPKKEAEELV